MALNNNVGSSGLESPLRVGTLNVRGFLGIKKRRAVLLNFKKEKLDIIGIQESHVGNEREANELRDQWKGVIHVCPCAQNRSKGVVTFFKSCYKEEDTKVIFASAKGTILISCLKLQGEHTVPVRRTKN